jgi:hypothetical protein
VKDVTFRKNLVRRAARGMNIHGFDDQQTSAATSRIVVEQNLFDDINPGHWLATDCCLGALTIPREPDELSIEHNTFIHTDSRGEGSDMIFFTRDAEPDKLQSFVLRNNIFTYKDFGIFGQGAGSGTAAITAYCDAATVEGNIFVGVPSASYPANNFYPATVEAVGFVNYNGGNGGDYRLATPSTFEGNGTDGTDPGADLDLVDEATAGVVLGIDPAATVSGEIEIRSGAMINARTMDLAEVTYCYELTSDAGARLPRQLPWAFVRFGDVGEDRAYVAPVGALGLTEPGRGVYRTFAEYMPFRGFPLEGSRPARVNSTDDLFKPGPLAVHFYGDV